MKSAGIHLLLILSPLLPGNTLRAQNTADTLDKNKEAVFFYIENFNPKVYGGGIQNFSTLQDDRGLIYIANSAGGLICDDVSWRLIVLPNLFFTENNIQ